MENNNKKKKWTNLKKIGTFNWRRSVYTISIGNSSTLSGSTHLSNFEMTFNRIFLDYPNRDNWVLNHHELMRIIRHELGHLIHELFVGSITIDSSEESSELFAKWYETTHWIIEEKFDDIVNVFKKYFKTQIEKGK